MKKPDFNRQSRGYLINRKHEIREKGKMKYCLTGWVSRKIALNTLFFFVIRNTVKYFTDTELFSITYELKMLILIFPTLIIIMGFGGYLEWDLQMNLMKVRSKDQEKVIKKRFISLYGVVLWGLPILLVNTFSYNYLNNDQVVLIVQLAFDALIFLGATHFIGRFLYKNKQKEYLS